jgi:hypothetical protein
MRKFFGLLLLLLGIGSGVLFTIAAKGDWAFGLVAVGMGILFTAPVAGAVAGNGGRSGRRRNSGSGGIVCPRHESSGGLFKGNVPTRRWDRW